MKNNITINRNGDILVITNIYIDGKKDKSTEIKRLKDGTIFQEIYNNDGEKEKEIIVKYVGNQKPKSWSRDKWYVFLSIVHYCWVEVRDVNRFEKEALLYERVIVPFDLSVKNPISNKSNEATPSAVIRHLIADYCKPEQKTRTGSGRLVGYNEAFEAFKDILYDKNARKTDFRVENMNLINKEKIKNNKEIREYVINKCGDSNFNKII